VLVKQLRHHVTVQYSKHTVSSVW